MIYSTNYNQIVRKLRIKKGKISSLNIIFLNSNVLLFMLLHMMPFYYFFVLTLFFHFLSPARQFPLPLSLPPLSKRRQTQLSLSRRRG